MQFKRYKHLQKHCKLIAKSPDLCCYYLFFVGISGQECLLICVALCRSWEKT